MFGLGLTNIIPFFLYSMAIVSVFVALFYREKYVLMFLVFLLPFTNILIKMHSYPFGKDVVDILLIAISVGWLLHNRSNSNKLYIHTPMNKPILIFIIFSYLGLWVGSFFFNVSFPLSLANTRFHTWKNYMILPILFFLTINIIKDKKSARWMTLIMVISIFLMGAYFFKDYRWIGKTVFRDTKRWVGTFVYLGPNEWGAFHVHFLFVMLGILLHDKLKGWWFLFLGAIIFSLYSVIFSYSRGAYVAAIICFVFIFLFCKRVFIVPIIIFMLFWQTLLPPAVLQRIEETKTEDGNYDPSAQTRLQLWKQGFEIFRESPILGVGFNTMPLVGLSNNLRDTHNIYVKVLAEQGIVGFIILFVLLFMCLCRGWQLYIISSDNFFKGLGLGFFTCTLALIITNLFGDRWSYVPLGSYFWVFMGLVERGNILMRKNTGK